MSDEEDENEVIEDLWEKWSWLTQQLDRFPQDGAMRAYFKQRLHEVNTELYAKGEI